MTEPLVVNVDLSALRPGEIEIGGFGDVSPSMLDLLNRVADVAWRGGLEPAAKAGAAAAWAVTWDAAYRAGYAAGWSADGSGLIPPHDHHDPITGGPVALPVLQIAPSLSVKTVYRDDAGDISRVIEVSAPDQSGSKVAAGGSFTPPVASTLGEAQQG